MRRTIELLSDLAVVAIALLLGFMVARSYFLGPEILQSSHLKPGQRLEAVKEIPWGSHEQILLLALRRGCSLCEDSIPFYKKLVDMQTSGAINAEIVAVFPDDSVATREYLESSGLEVRSIPNFRLRKLEISMTPAVLLVNRNGEVLGSWGGLLSPRQEEDLLNAIKLRQP